MDGKYREDTVWIALSGRQAVRVQRYLAADVGRGRGSVSGRS